MMALAFITWGLATIYWKRSAGVEPMEVVAHRIVWSLVVLAMLLTITKRWPELVRCLRSRRSAATLALSSAMLGTNWYVFVWGVTNGRILECSLGYFINPLVSVVLGWAFLGERLGRWQLVALAMTACAVANLVVAHGQVPWAGLVLAGSFGLYGLLRKTSAVPAIPGLTVETALLTVPAAGLLVWLNSRGRLTMGHVDLTTDAYLVGAGLITVLPLLMFGYGVQRIRLATVGFIQYLAPSCMLLLGVLIYGEPLGPRRLVTFATIWLALAIYSADSAKKTAGDKR